LKIRVIGLKVILIKENNMLQTIEAVLNPDGKIHLLFWFPRASVNVIKSWSPNL